VRLVGALLYAALVLPAQISIPGINSPPAAKGDVIDPMGRHTPRSSITGFLKAVQQGRYRNAAYYLQLTPAQRDSRGHELARELQVLFDSGYQHPLSWISNRPEGSQQDQMPPDEERAGEFAVRDESLELLLVRVEEPEVGQVWLVSSQTLARVPAVSRRVTAFRFVEDWPSWTQIRWGGMALWQWLGVAVLFLVALAIAWAIIWALLRVLRGTRYRLTNFPKLATLLLAVTLHGRMIPVLAVPLLVRSYYNRAIGVLTLFGFVWLVLRGIDRGAERIREAAVAAGKINTGSWMVLGQRILKALVVLIAFLSFLSLLGFDISTALAGVGIGGVAIAFAAQKTLENLFGGVSVASDRVIRVGDTLRLGTTVGTVVDIGLRSTRLRTLERSELSIPNGVLANMNVENLSMRDKLLFQSTMGLLFETAPEKMRAILERLNALLANDPRVDPEGRRVRFVNFGESSLNVEVFCYIATGDWQEFLRVREDLLLKIMDIVHEEGSGFAFPSRTVYHVHEDGRVEKDEGGKSQLGGDE
jgi:MscS family membrane protein